MVEGFADFWGRVGLVTCNGRNHSISRYSACQSAGSGVVFLFVKHRSHGQYSSLQSRDSLCRVLSCIFLVVFSLIFSFPHRRRTTGKTILRQSNQFPTTFYQYLSPPSHPPRQNAPKSNQENTTDDRRRVHRTPGATKHTGSSSPSRTGLRFGQRGYPHHLHEHFYDSSGLRRADPIVHHATTSCPGAVGASFAPTNPRGSPRVVGRSNRRDD